MVTLNLERFRKKKLSTSPLVSCVPSSFLISSVQDSLHFLSITFFSLFASPFFSFLFSPMYLNRALLLPMPVSPLVSFLRSKLQTVEVKLRCSTNSDYRQQFSIEWWVDKPHFPSSASPVWSSTYSLFCPLPLFSSTAAASFLFFQLCCCSPVLAVASSVIVNDLILF